MLADLLSKLLAVEPTPIRFGPRVSQSLRSACCDVSVVQNYEWGDDLLPVTCGKCGTELGCPGLEDIGALSAREWLLTEQWGCDGKSPRIAACTAECPRHAHHHHDRKCLPPVLVQIDEAARHAW